VDPTGETHNTPESRRPEPDKLEDLVEEFAEPSYSPEPSFASEAEVAEPTVGEHPLVVAAQGPATEPEVPMAPERSFQEHQAGGRGHQYPSRKPKKKSKPEVAKDGAKRGGIEGVVVYAITQLALSYGAPPELLAFITEANIALLAGAATVIIRVAEALIADGGATDERSD
jgi:hypothetical protein